MIDIEKYLNEKKEGYRVIRGEKPQFALKRSPCCGALKKDKFYISCETGKWDCKLCDEKGDFNGLRDLFLDDHVKLEGNQKFETKKEHFKKGGFREVGFEELSNLSARLLGLRPQFVEYIENRGINIDTIKEFQLGVNEYERLSIPIFRNGKVIDIISGHLPGQSDNMERYMHAQGSDSLGLLNGAVLEKRTKPKTMIITEGSFDCMTIWQNITKDVVGTVGGATNVSKKWKDNFRGVELIYIIYDNDEPGRVGVKSLMELLGQDRCVDIQVPKEYSDINEFFGKNHNAKKLLLDAMEKHKPKRNDSVKHFAEFGDKILRKISEGEAKGIDTGFPALNAIISGYKPGQLILLGALTSVGKTTEALNLMLALAYIDTPSYFTSLEMTPEQIGQKLIQMSEGIRLSDIHDREDGTIKRVEGGISKLSNKPLYLFDGSGLMSYELVENGIRSAVKEYGVRVAFIDYLQYFALEGNNRTAEIGDLTNSIKALAVELGITIFLITQLNRSGRSKQKTGLYIPDLTDLKDSSTLEQSADVVIFLCRDSESASKSEQGKAVLKIAKNRDGKTGHLSLNFDGETGVFSQEMERDYLSEFTGEIAEISVGDAKDIFS